MNITNRDWILTYLDYLIEGNLNEAQNLKIKYFPKSLFKYRKLESKTIENIKNGKIWLAEIESLNDPFECSIQFDNNACLRLTYTKEVFSKDFKDKFGFELSEKEIQKIVISEDPFVAFSDLCYTKNIKISVTSEEQKAEIQKVIDNEIKEANKNFRICCFSEIYDSLLMWSHYAEDHKGICIEYDFSNEQNICSFLHPIYYNDKIFKINTFKDFTRFSHIAASLNKCQDWAYEAEWRLVILKWNNIIPEKITVSKPIGIYLGTRFNQNPKRMKLKLMKVIKELNIPIYNMEKDSTEYKLAK